MATPLDIAFVSLADRVAASTALQTAAEALTQAADAMTKLSLSLEAVENAARATQCLENEAAVLVGSSLSSDVPAALATRSTSKASDVRPSLTIAELYETLQHLSRGARVPHVTHLACASLRFRRGSAPGRVTAFLDRGVWSRVIDAPVDRCNPDDVMLCLFACNNVGDDRDTTVGDLADALRAYLPCHAHLPVCLDMKNISSPVIDVSIRVEFANDRYVIDAVLVTSGDKPYHPQDRIDAMLTPAINAQIDLAIAAGDCMAKSHAFSDVRIAQIIADLVPASWTVDLYRVGDAIFARAQLQVKLVPGCELEDSFDPVPYASDDVGTAIYNRVSIPETSTAQQRAAGRVFLFVAKPDASANFRF